MGRSEGPATFVPSLEDNDSANRLDARNVPGELDPPGSCTVAVTAPSQPQQPRFETKSSGAVSRDHKELREELVLGIAAGMAL